jgi:hypothetical protein
MQGVTVTLRLGGSDVLTTTTDATGAYTFTGVLPAKVSGARDRRTDQFPLDHACGRRHRPAITQRGRRHR